MPTVDPQVAQELYGRLHEAMKGALVRSCHDLSEGGLAVALAEMSFAGDLGVEIDLQAALEKTGLSGTEYLFSESNSRFLVEVEPGHEAAFDELIAEFAERLGQVVAGDEVTVSRGSERLLQSKLSELKRAWQSPLDWE